MKIIRSEENNLSVGQLYFILSHLLSLLNLDGHQNIVNMYLMLDRDWETSGKTEVSTTKGETTAVTPYYS
jgi:hypothetical protein